MNERRKYKDGALTEIGGNGGFTHWRYYDPGVTYEEMMEPSFFKYFQVRVSPQSRIKPTDQIKLHGSNGFVESLVMEVGMAPDFLPKLMPLGKATMFPSAQPQASKKAA